MARLAVPGQTSNAFDEKDVVNYEWAVDSQVAKDGRNYGHVSKQLLMEQNQAMLQRTQLFEAYQKNRRHAVMDNH